MKKDFAFVYGSKIQPVSTYIFSSAIYLAVFYIVLYHGIPASVRLTPYYTNNSRLILFYAVATVVVF